MTKDETYIYRCIELAKKGAGFVAPNPMVGAILVYNDAIIGEGWHEQYGQPHAEINCINSVKQEHKQFISSSTLYVSLEPCNHFGKTPPCCDRIILEQIKKVVVGCKDPFTEVNGAGIDKLKAAGVQVVVNVLKDACENLNQRFFIFHTKHRSYIILKWAQTGDGKTAPLNLPQGETYKHLEIQRLLISNEYTNRLVHKWRSEEAAILVGTNTALMDDPQLTNRYWEGKQPLRLVIDKELKLPPHLKLFNSDARTIVFNLRKHTETGQPQYYQINKEQNVVEQIVTALYQLNIQSVLVEGGAKLLQSFIDAGLWDEARILTNEQLIIENGLYAPILSSHKIIREEKIATDRIMYYKNLQF